MESHITSIIIRRAELYAIKAHADTNHYYDDYIPYEFHLRLVHKAAVEFCHLITDVEECQNALAASWLHDCIEDARKNYSDIKKVFNTEIAEIVRAVTNYGRGRNRDERMPDECYKDIRETSGADFVKLADRIANVQYSILTGSRMTAVYREENKNFIDKAISKDSNRHITLKPMIDKLNQLLWDQQSK